jgi:hypothetical protein
MTDLNFVDLIENNPITKLSNTYNSKLLQKIKEQFTGFEQQLFISSFYCYLNYDKNNDFVVDLDNIWKWMGFKQKINAKMILEKYFKVDIDYKEKSAFVVTKALFENVLPNYNSSLDEEKTAFPDGKAVFVKQNGGQNKQTILLTVKCFKSLCLKAQTKKASEIHEYYMKLEEVLQEIVESETDELRLQLEQKNAIIMEINTNNIQEKIKLTKEKQIAVEKAIIVQFPIYTECIYIGTIENTNESGEKLIKFGHTNNLSTRVLDHHKIYTNFVLINAFRVQNKVEIENLIKSYPKIKKQIRTIDVNGKSKTELIAYTDSVFTIDKLTNCIKDIIHSKTYSIDNFNRVIKRNEELETENKVFEESNKRLTLTSIQQINEISYLKEILENKQKIINSIKIENKSVYENVLLPEDDMNTKFNEFVRDICIVRPDVDELSINLEGRYRLWSQVKPTKEVFHALKSYLDTRFKPTRIQRNHGYIGVKLKQVEYTKNITENSDVQTFVFQVCKFSDCGKILNSVLLKEYQSWKISVNKELTNNDMRELKDYLNISPYALKATVWTDEGSNEGYYGIGLKQIDTPYKLNIISSTGKKVYKRETNTDILLGTWDSIVKASEGEGINASKMSRCIKNKIVIKDYYYCVI